MPSPSAITLIGSAARTASGQGSAIDIGYLNSVRARVEVLAVSGTSPTLTVTFETSPDGISGWRPLGTTEAIWVAGLYRKPVGDASRWIRAVWTIGGTTPSFLFGVAGEALQVYATKDDFYRMGLPASAIGSVSDDQIEEALESASAVAAGFIRNHNALPLTTWDDDLRRAVVHIAQYDVLAVRGFNPEGNTDQLVVKRHDDAIEWLKLVARGNVSLAAVDATPSTFEGTITVTADVDRGWDSLDGSSSRGEPMGSFWFESD